MYEQSAPPEEIKGVEFYRQLEAQLLVLVEASNTLLSSLELNTVLPAILDLAKRLVVADAYGLWRFQPATEEWRILAAHGLSPDYQLKTTRDYGSALPFNQPIIAEDIEQIPRLATRLEGYRQEGIRALLVVPLRIQGTTAGSITFYFREPHHFSEIEVHAATALANLAAAALGSAELYEEQKALRHQAETSQQRLAFLAKASGLLASSLDYETTLQSVAQLVVPHLADWCTVSILNERGFPQQLALAHVDPAKVEWARVLQQELQQRHPYDPQAPSGLAKVLRTGQAEFYPVITEEMLVAATQDKELLRLMRGIGFSSAMIIPLVGRERVLGAIQFVSAEGGYHYTPQDLEQAQDLAQRAALAIDNAWLYQEAQVARQAAESAADRTARLQTITAALAEVRTPTQIAQIIVEQAATTLEAQTGRILCLVEDGKTLETLAVGGASPQPLELEWRIPLEKALAVMEAVQTGRPLWIEDLSQEKWATRYPQLLQALPTSNAGRALVILPLEGTAQTLLGVLLLSFEGPRPFSSEEQNFIITLGRQYGQAIERLQTYEAQQQARTAAQIRLITDTVPAQIHYIDAQKHFVFVNQRFEAWVGLSSAQIIGKSLKDILGDDLYQYMDPYVERALRGEEVTYEQSRPDLDGQVRHFSISYTPHFGEAGEVLGFFTLIQDITERKETELQLRFLASLQENMSDAVVAQDLELNIRTWNKAAEKIYGWSAEEAIGKTGRELLITNILSGESNQEIIKLVREQGYWSGEALQKRHDGSSVYILMSATVFNDNEGNPIGFVTVNRDITERKQAEEAIRQLSEINQQRVLELTALNRELEAFSYSVSHDLRAPLRGIEGFSQVLLEDYTDKLDQTGQDYLKRVRRASQHMAQLIDDLLNLSRVTRTEIHYETIELSELARQIISQLQQTEPTRPVQLEIMPALRVRGDRNLLEVVLVNLLGNAWKFSRRCAIARIEFGLIVQKEDNLPVYFVRDNGAGFDMRYASKLFGAFQRLHSTSEFEGTGIGLATVQRIIHRHGGRVWAESTVGQGATFYFTLSAKGANSDA